MTDIPVSEWECHTLDSLIGALAELRKTEPGGLPVVLQKDAEGNGYSPMTRHPGIDIAMYAPETTWFGEVYLTEADRIATEDPDEYEAAPANAVRAIILTPIN